MSKVYLIGAGPGNEELVTLKALKVLKECDVVLYDRLAGGNLLKYLKESCKIYYCGKEPGSHYKTQEEINDMLVSFAKEGYTVGRIKGGDPYVFGRGGEEALRLSEEGLEFEVIPGVTSAISVLSYAGIPVTHRGKSQSFHVFTGRSAGKLDFNWASIATLKGTLIFLMGLENLETIATSLIENGMEESTICAVVMRGTTSKQRKVISTLKNITKEVARAGFKSPCIIVVGSVIELSSTLDWYEKKTLYGLNVCVTRAKEQAADMRDKLISLGAEVTEINSIKIVDTAYNLDNYIEHIEKYDYIVMNSVNSVNIFFKYLRDKNIDVRKLRGSFAVIGPSTEKALKEKGIIAEVVAEEFVGEKLAEKLASIVKAGDRILIPCSKDARTYTEDTLRKIGCIVDRVEIYSPELGELLNERVFEDVDVVLFTSPSTVRNMIKLVGSEAIKQKVALAIGPITEKELKANNIECYVSERYNSEGIISKLVSIKDEIKSLGNLE